MPKFVAVTDPEKALSEQHGDPSMAKHRAWESKQYVTVNKLGDNLTPSAPGGLSSRARRRRVQSLTSSTAVAYGHYR
jgi:hypothetical protein